MSLPVSQELQQRAMSAWPGPVTWLFPRADSVPDWLAGKHDTIALRLTAHPVPAGHLCAAFQWRHCIDQRQPEFIRTAGKKRRTAWKNILALCLGGIVAGGTLGKRWDRPSEIRDLASGAVIRER